MLSHDEQCCDTGMIEATILSQELNRVGTDISTKRRTPSLSITQIE